MPAPRDLPQQATPPIRGRKLGCESPSVDADFLCKFRGKRGGSGYSKNR